MTREATNFRSVRLASKAVAILNLSLFAMLALIQATSSANAKAKPVGFGQAGIVSTKVGYTAIPPIPPPAGTGNTYYVSSPLNPAVDQANRALLPAGATVFSSLQAAADVTQPGDTVLAMNGTYVTDSPVWVIGVLNITTSGSAAGGYITYAAYPGAHPIITSTSTYNIFNVVDIAASYIVFQGFEIIGSAQKVTLAFANQATAVGLVQLKQEAQAGQYAYITPGPARWLTNGNCIAAADVSHVMILNNLVHDCSGAGIDFEKSDYQTIEANTVYNTSWWTIYDTSGISLHLALNSDSSTGYKNFVLDNISYDNANTQPFYLDSWNNYVKSGSAPEAPTDGNGIIIDTNESTNDGSPYLGRTLVAGNIAYGNGGSGVHAYLSNHVDIINNTAYLNDTCPVAGSTCGAASTLVNGVPVSGNVHGQIYALSGSDNNLYNNVLYAPVGKYISNEYSDTLTVESNNLLYSANGQIILGGYTAAATDVLANPLFANSAVPSQNNFLLSKMSSGIGAGIVYTNQGISVPALLGLQVTHGHVNLGAQQ